MKYAVWILLGSFTILIIGAVALLSLKPADLAPMNPTVVKDVIPQAVVPGMSDLPILATGIPEFQGISKWWNTTDGKPLTPEGLKGKVVLIDFWTYSCINCIRTQPFMREIWNKYKDDGLVIIGVHTPEFAFEKVPANVEAAIKKAQLEYPIALDAEYATWNAYSNRYWPAGYFFDRQGRLRHFHFGEGDYEKQEEVIRELLAEETTLTDAPTRATTPNFNLTKTHETYFGSSRLSFLANPEYKAGAEVEYVMVGTTPDQWSLDGLWKITPEYAASLRNGNRFRMNVESNAMHLVLGSMDGAKLIRILIDGKDPTAAQRSSMMLVGGKGTEAKIEVREKQLYTVARFPEGGRHTVEIEFPAGLEMYAATFGE